MARAVSKEDTLFRMGLLNIAEKLHMHCTGASDPLDADEAYELSRYLCRRLDNWKTPALLRTSTYDSCVRELLEIAVREFEDYRP